MATTHKTIVGLEERFWQSMVDKDPRTAMALMADQGIVTGPTGTMEITPEKYGEMTEEGQWSLDSFEFSDVSVVLPADNIAVIAYKVRQKGSMGDQTMDLRCADASTWVKVDGEWKVALHTETILDHMPLTN